VSPVGRSFRLPARCVPRGRCEAGQGGAGMEVEARARREDERRGRRLAALRTTPPCPWRRHSAAGEQFVSSVSGEMVGVS
jgi:hypothetical protein